LSWWEAEEFSDVALVDRDTDMVPMYESEVRHAGLGKYHVLRCKDPEVLRQKTLALLAQWEEMWKRRQESEAKRKAREFQARSKEEKLIVANMKTEQAEELGRQLVDILRYGIDRATESQWDRLKDNTEFPKPKPDEPYFPLVPYVPDPVLPLPPKEPVRPEIPKKPIAPDISEKVSQDEPRFQPVVSLRDSIIPGRVQKIRKEAEDFFLQELGVWEQKIRVYNEKVATHNACLLSLKRLYHEEKRTYRTLRSQYEEECNRIIKEHDEFVGTKNQEHNEQLNRLKAQHLETLSKWEQEKKRYYDEQAKRNRSIAERREDYLSCNATDIIEYSDMILTNSQYPDYFPQNFELDYIEETRTLLVDYALPRIEDIPAVKTVKYNQRQDEFVYTNLSESALNKLYEDVNYQIALRTLFELFSTDDARALDAVVFNGFVDTIDKATGQRIRPCIMSIQVCRSEFELINLEQVDPKACFRKLKGVSAAKLHALAPVAPVAQINREDRRFVDSYDVASGLDGSVNLASIDWEDFEHLIRELFGKEFATGGGEVKVTQASRDGGVDAVAFDPDPIRGGKIVIQAKRYTNVVGVAAVRDLWGTISHEGAMKGILVTTSNYGPDAYEFAKGKPITLLDGGNLLHLLAKHGHRAKIDLKEAKKEMTSRSKEK
jgi:restriction system protein